jgi:hypothetical protein
MEAIRAETENKAMTIEKMKGLFTEEGKEFTSNYNLRSNSTFITMRKSPEANVDKGKLVLELYGNNVGMEQVRELMMLCRTQV